MATTTLPVEVTPLLEALLGGVQDALGENIVGVYLCGSLALGGFDPETSDVDVLVVTQQPVSDAEFASLRAFHERMPVEGNEFGRAYEVYYIDRATLRRFAPGQRHVKAGSDEEFGWKPQRRNWVIERWTVREHGLVVQGPDPAGLIDPVTTDDLREAARSELRIRIADWARDGVEPEPWLQRRGGQAYEVITVCRALYTIECADLPSKSKALEWALANLPQEWQPVARWAWEHRDDRTFGTEMLPELIRFVRWAVESLDAR